MRLETIRSMPPLEIRQAALTTPLPQGAVFNRVPARRGVQDPRGSSVLLRDRGKSSRGRTGAGGLALGAGGHGHQRRGGKRRVPASGRGGGEARRDERRGLCPHRSGGGAPGALLRRSLEPLRGAGG